MKQTDHILRSLFFAASLGIIAAALLCLGLLAATPASAAFEQVGTFAGSPTPVQEEKFSEEVQLGGVGGLAVNINGAGGVPAGTVYAAVHSGPGVPVRVAMFTPTVNGGLIFSQRWDVAFYPDPLYDRCGPMLGTKCSNQGQSMPEFVDVDVDQATGNVYVYNGTASAPGLKRIAVYKPDGSAEITRFGEDVAFGETTAESPEMLHENNSVGPMAVDSSGAVYVFDSDGSYQRLMKFEPKTPGNYEEYVYAGTEDDVAAGFLGDAPKRPGVDAAGHIYVAPQGFGSEKRIAEYDPSKPGDPPICQFEYSKGGITSFTVNPANGEVFFFTYKPPKLVHRLSPCNEQTGKFTETDSFKVTPERDDLSALAFDPARKFSPSRSVGVLYGGAPSASSSEGVGKGEPGQSSLGYIFAPVEENPPVVEAESVTHVTSSTAELGVQINPRGSQTSFTFQYIADAAYQANEPTDRFSGASEAPLGGGELGSGQGALGATIALSGLSPDTKYHYRAIATSHCSLSNPEKFCEGTGADQAFHTFPVQAPGLPDERAYELVSPTDKHGGEVFPADPSFDSCGGCKPGFTSAHFPMQSSPDGEAIVYEGQAFSFSEGAVNENQYIARRDEKTGWQTTILSPALAGRGGPEESYEAFNAELTRGLLSQRSRALTPDAPSGYANLYAQPTATPLALGPLLLTEPPNRTAGNLNFGYASASADLSRVFFKANDALTGETPFAPEAVDGGSKKNNLYEWAAGQLRLVNVAPGNAATASGAAFAEGDANAISDDGSRAFWSDEAGQLYVRENAESTKAIPGPGKFLSASADGSKVLLSDGHLYDLETEATTDLAEGKGGFQGIVGQSEDLSHLYFVDTAVLDQGLNEQGAMAEAGKDNLYAWHEGAVRYVATLAAQDNGNRSGDWASSPGVRTAEASPDGGWVTFLSQAPLTGYDNIGPCESDHAGGFVGAPCSEAFLYDSAFGELTCASCNPSGERPLGPTLLRLIAGGDSLPQPRYLTDSGRLYFDSTDSLTPADTNDGVEDVYQYEPDGVGTCKRQAGCVSLISAGHEPVDSNFLAMDEDGQNVFFTTRDQLVLKDRDELIDLYVAREKGGIASETEVARGECQGEACQAAISPPNDPTPGSSTFEGAGNVDERKAAKKHKKKKHAKKAHHKKRANKRAANHNRGGAK